MQFHHNGYVSQDPRCHSPNENWIHRTDELPDEMDVLIIGSGPASSSVATGAWYSVKQTASRHAR